MTAQPNKDTIYIDAEDEITAIIDKVKASDSKIVALVLPKRSPTLQSVVNLKLLKRMAAEAKKNLVLITSEASLLPLAGAVGLHVAKTLQSKPAIPTPPLQQDKAITVDSDQTPAEDEPLDPNATIGQLAGQVATEDTIELDNEAASSPVDKVSKGKNGLNKKLKIPNFNRFRLLFFGGIALLILIIVGSYFALVVLPKARIVIKTDTSSIATDLKLLANTDAKNLDIEQGIIPAVKKELKKSDSEKVPTTGQKNEGEKAKGTVKIYNCNKDDKLSDTIRSLPAGTVVSASGFNFALTEAVDVEPSSFTGNICQRNKPSASTGVIAQNSGDQYNLGQRKYSVAGYPSMDADGSDMKGGTTKIVKIVSQADIDTAKQKIIERIGPTVGNELKNQFTNENILPLVETITAGDPIITSSPNINDAANEVSVTVTITYTELGVKQDDIKQVVETEVKKHIKSSEQVIQDNGISKATVKVIDRPSPAQANFQIQTVAIAGPQLDADGIKKQIAGKRKGETQSLIQARAGTKEVEIKYSPFWVHSTPKKASRITIIFEQNGG